MLHDRELERIVRGYSNHRRIQMLRLIQKTPGLSVSEIASILHIHLKTAAEHLRRLSITRLIYKRSRKREILHALSSRGKNVLTFLRTLE